MMVSHSQLALGVGIATMWTGRRQPGSSPDRCIIIDLLLEGWKMASAGVLVLGDTLVEGYRQ